MKNVLVCFGVVFLVAGCMTIQEKNSKQSCELLNIALSESGDLAPAWYENAGVVLQECGYKDGNERGELAACYADRVNDHTKVCK